MKRQIEQGWRRLCLGMALALCGPALSANLLVSVDEVESKGSQGRVRFTMENQADQPIKAARAWIFLFDEQGKVMGNHAFWAMDGRDEKKYLAQEDKQSHEVWVPSKGTVARAEVTFSRIVLADGTTPNPQKFVKPAEKKED